MLSTASDGRHDVAETASGDAANSPACADSPVTYILAGHTIRKLEIVSALPRAVCCVSVRVRRE